MLHFKYLAFVGATLLLIISACSENTYTPKPRGYFRTEFPEKSYQTFDSTYPYKFQYPKYAQIQADKEWNSEKYWANVTFGKLHAEIHLTYKKIEKNLPELTEDTRKLAYKHTIKADAITPIEWVNNEKKVYGLLFDIKGNAASTLQFYLTDSVEHFVRGSFYFNTIPNKDSLAPSQKFLREDIDKLIETFEWKSL